MGFLQGEALKMLSHRLLGKTFFYAKPCKKHCFLIETFPYENMRTPNLKQVDRKSVVKIGK